MGGFWGPESTIDNGNPVSFQNMLSVGSVSTAQPTITDFFAGTNKFSAANNNGTDVLTTQQSMSTGLLSFPAPIEKVYILAITDEHAYHYHGGDSLTTHLDAVKLGCITGVGANGTTIINGLTATDTGLTLPATISTIN